MRKIEPDLTFCPEAFPPESAYICDLFGYSSVFSIGFEDCLQVFDGADKPSFLGGINESDEEEEELQVWSKIALVIMLFLYDLVLSSNLIPAASLFIHPSIFLATFPFLRAEADKPKAAPR